MVGERGERGERTKDRGYTKSERRMKRKWTHEVIDGDGDEEG